MQSILTSAQVQQHAAALLRTHLRLTDYGVCCPVATWLAVVFTACCRLGSLFAATRRLCGAPSHETVRQALRFNLPDRDRLQRQLNHALVAHLPRGLTRRRHRLALDLTLIPYHGQPTADRSGAPAGDPGGRAHGPEGSPPQRGSGGRGEIKGAKQKVSGTD